jgi:hypothetical protein
MIPGISSCGIKLITTVIIAINKLEVIKPKPYNTNIKTLFLGVFEIPNDQKKNMALSSHGINVWRIPKKNAGAKINSNGGG